MGTINPPIPELGLVGSQPATDIVDALTEMRDEINGNLSNDNFAALGFGRDKWPEPTWQVQTTTSNIVLAGGLPVSGTSGVLYGLQNIGPGLSPPEDGVVREVSISLTWSKAAKLGGGNDATNELVLQTFNTPTPGEIYSPNISAVVPGSDGLRTAYTGGVAAAATGLAGYYLTNATIGNPAGTFVYGDIGETVGVVATGASAFSGLWTIHRLTIRYRDWEF